MTTFAQAATIQSTRTETTNGMGAFTTTGSELVDLFYTIGSARNAQERVVELFDAAYRTDPTSALRTLFWARDVRGGAGERQTFRTILLSLEKNEPQTLVRLLPFVAEYGRFDDLLIFSNPAVKNAAYGIIAGALNAGNGLAAKWAPREKSAKRAVAVELAQFMGLSSKQYRKLLATGSSTVEDKMCAKQWDDINYGHVPSVASARYAKAFGRHDQEGYTAYLEAVKKGEAKINASAIFPHDVLKGCATSPDTVIAQWDALPDYMGDTAVFPMIDVSGSMGCPAGGTKTTCMDVAIALGLYVATKQKGAFKDLYLTFDDNPKIIKAEGTIVEKARQCRNAPWGGSTNVEAGLKLILGVATDHKVAQEDMPKYLIIFSDMQFNQATTGYSSYRGYKSDTMMETSKKLYEAAGYEMPTVIFWNLNGEYGNQPATATEGNVLMVSGFATPMIKSVLAGKVANPLDLVLEVINSPRYAQIGGI